jgi:Bacterial membrane protein YfhO
VKIKLFFLIAFTVLILAPFIYKLPIPADTIPGLYHPMRDIQFGYPNGVPVENPLITDPVRQQFVWKFLAVNEIKQGKWPLWNPYNLTGTPLLANFQTAAFYPLNVIFFVPNIFGGDELQHFATLWSYYIYLQIPLSILFMYLYLRKIGLSELASLYGGGIWAFAGFTTAWWEWGNVVHTVLYFPLILYAIEGIVERDPVRIVENTAIRKSFLHPLITLNKYKIILLFAMCSSFFAGHLQTFLLVAVNSVFYVLYKIPLVRIIKGKLNFESTRRRLYFWMQLFQVGILFALIVSIQSLPTLDFLGKSARNIDPNAWQRKDWFYPAEHFISFLAPDFFGNPATYNYWGVWNYGEFAAYIGIFPLLFALAIVMQFIYDELRKLIPKMSFRLSHKEVSSETLDIVQENAGVGFFLIALFINLVLITRNPLTEIIYSWNIPFLTTTQPSRGIAIVDFSLIILSAVGFHKTIRVLKSKTSLTSFLSIKTNINFSYILLFFCFAALWIGVVFQHTWFTGVIDTPPNFDIYRVARNNLILPTAFFIVAFFALRFYYKSLENDYKKNKEIIQARMSYLIIGVILTFTVLDVGRFFLKFQTFSKREFLYPQASIIDKLSQLPLSRYMTEDSRIMAPNMNIPYGVSTVEGYDPLYLSDYGKLVGLWQRNEPNLSPFNANRILTPHTPKSIIADISATSHLLSFGDYTVYPKAGEIGQTKLFERPTAVPRIFIMPAMRGFNTEQDLVDYMFSSQYDPSGEGLFILKGDQTFQIPSNGFYTFLGSRSNHVVLSKYTPTELTIQATLSDNSGLLYIADSFEEGWKAYVNDKEVPIIKTNIAFRGIQLPQGEHSVVLKYMPQSFTVGFGVSVLGLIITSLLFFVSTRKTR